MVVYIDTYANVEEGNYRCVRNYFLYFYFLIIVGCDLCLCEQWQLHTGGSSGSECQYCRLKLSMPSRYLHACIYMFCLPIIGLVYKNCT